MPRAIELRVPAYLRHPSVLIRVVWRPARLHDFRCQACSEPDLRRPACSRPSQDRPRWSGPLERLSSRRSSRATLDPGPHFTPFPPASSCVAVGLPLTRQRGNRPGFLPSEESRHARPVAFLGRGSLATPPRSAWSAVTYPTQKVAYMQPPPARRAPQARSAGSEVTCGAQGGSEGAQGSRLGPFWVPNCAITWPSQVVFVYRTPHLRGLMC